MTTCITPDWFGDFASRIMADIAQGLALMQQAAAIYVEAITREPAFKDWIADQHPQIPGGFWRSLEGVGRGTLDARIAQGGVSYPHKLRRLPLSEQRQALDGCLPYLTATGDTLRITIDGMSNEQAEQIFAADHIRSLAEQKAWQESQSGKVKATIKPTVAVEIDRRRRRIVVNGYPITATELADYLAKITRP